MNLSQLVHALDNLVTEGKFLEAANTYFDEEVACFSHPQNIIRGKSQKIRAMEEFMATVDEVRQIDLHNWASGDGISLSHFTFSFLQNDGNHLRWEEVIRREWRDGKVVLEEYMVNKPWEEALQQSGLSDPGHRQSAGQTNVHYPGEAGTFVDGNRITIVELPEEEIPDNEAEGITRTVEVKSKGVVEDIEVSIDLRHSFRGDLVVTLTSPSKERAVLHDREGASANNLQKTYTKTTLAPLLGSKSKGKWKLNIVDKAARDVGVLNWWKLYLKAIEPDDLKKIEGIGPKSEEILQKAGILTFLKLANLRPSEIREIFEAAGTSRYNPATWPEQARLAYLGKWDELKELQDELYGGRRVK